MELNKYIDHTLLKSTAEPVDIERLCEEAIEYNFYAVCVNGCYVKLANSLLKNSNVKIASVVGFPLGAMSTESKTSEAENAVNDGADEIDMVINLGKLKAKEYTYIENEIRKIKEILGDKILKVIIEASELKNEEKIIACELAEKAGADFVKTSTGFASGGAKIEDVKLMNSAISDRMKIKASGGIRDQETAKNYIELGVSRIGTSSGISIVKIK
ncbi:MULTISPECIES: deoxyribose-phosphate aldolase [Mesonia]|uniref:Deoxyribose-phosphate aldolase n=1 Tax=Mesonia oceanica TaxID=2687242 RepID=A0AC61Y6I4_9FLAO|nr:MULTISPECIES: deoxyribose-phosphate aldolase [Mesonia]MAN26074.1 deoxyribose-phosphate aldolase [Mesonia sp.]MAQ42207.1 deoxyribose-phosphate aldolase [Mesonia sp.]MBJ97925.1 deoxyribose-phosphate aldolase [Flavobacteriaceae bacterium]VVV00092.1 Deoxyribose-phosphate aldolase [Mesonia oceanica]|tara:strand:+ start:21438 stop:22082 length:645 start_codon:yes stop_codon:yes gene_type:complete